MLPLVEGMPVALTEHIDRGRQLLKGAEGTLAGLWLDTEEPRPTPGQNGELVLRRLPMAALVKFPHIDDPVKIPLKTGRWCLNPSRRSTVRSLGKLSETTSCVKTGAGGCSEENWRGLCTPRAASDNV